MIRYTKWAIWLYVFLLIFEGALRKWVLPGLAEPLLIIRDPVALLIYALAVASNRLPKSAFLAVTGVLALGSILFSFLAGQTNIFVMVYGLRTNYLHLPLIWVMVEVLDREDIEQLGSFLLVTAIPMTLLMALQWHAPQGAWVNRGVGGDESGGIYGALGHMRPPGFFSFITGVMVFYPLVAAFCLYQLSQRRQLWWIVLLACAAAIIVAMPVSISRGAVIGTGLVAVGFAISVILSASMGLKVGGPMLLKIVVRMGIASVIIIAALSFLPAFEEYRSVFMDRWDTASNEVEGKAWNSLADRVLIAFTTPIDYALAAPVFGYGVGVGSSVGAKLLAGRAGFLLAEDEWGKCLGELGPILGFAFIFMRIALVIHLFGVAFKAMKQNQDLLPMLIWWACFPVILLNQWGQATQLGFAVVGGGLLLTAALKPHEDEEEEDGEDEDSEDEGEEPLTEIELQRRRMRGLM